MTRRSKKINPAALNYLRWRASMRDVLSLLLLRLRSTPDFPLPALWDGPVRVRLQFPQGVRGDLDNLVKAVVDALQNLVYLNDRQVRELHAVLGPGPDTIIEVAPL
jgi:hypothetical protein